MRYKELDQLLHESLREERAEARDLLEGMEHTVTVKLASRLSGRPSWRKWWRMLSHPPLAMRGAVAVGIVLALAVGFLAGRMWGPGGFGFEETTGTMFAVAAPQAESVSVKGDFSAWEPVNLEDRGSGVWTAVIELPPGRYEYAFVVDGRWVGQDPVADEYVRSFGEYASVRYVEGDR